MHRYSRMIAFALSVCASTAFAQEPPSPEQVQRLLTMSMGPNLTLSRYLEVRRAEFAILDIDGDGAITAADLDFHRLHVAADRRATTIGEILYADLDGDGIVTADEIMRQLGGMLNLRAFAKDEAAIKEQLKAAVAIRMRADRNGDGKIDGAEMLAHAKQQLGAGPVQVNPMVAVALAMDEDHDGRTTLAEYLKGVEQAFRTVDADGDGTISKEEAEAHRKQGLRPAR